MECEYCPSTNMFPLVQYVLNTIPVNFAHVCTQRQSVQDLIQSCRGKLSLLGHLGKPISSIR